MRAAMFDRPLYYHLIEGEIVPAPEDRRLLFQPYEQRVVGRAVYYLGEVEVLVDTCFLNIDHNHSGVGPPMLFETLIVWPDHELNDRMWRYHTLAEAKAGHERAVALVRNAILKEEGLSKGDGAGQ